jgi:predicted RNA-binding protein with PUA-like domain
MSDKSIIGIAKISREGYPDPKAGDWVVVDIVPEKKLKKSITLAEVKGNKKLQNMVLVKNSRLSVQPVREEEFDRIIVMSED